MVGWGIYDFLGGVFSKQIGSFKSLFWSQLAGLISILLLALALTADFNLPMLALGRIPGRRDVGVGSREDRQRVAERRKLPLRVGPGHMPVERAELAFALHEVERQRRRLQPFGRRRHQRRQPRLAHHGAQRRGVVFAESGRRIH